MFLSFLFLVPPMGLAGGGGGSFPEECETQHSSNFTGNLDCLTLVRVQPPQEQCCPTLPLSNYVLAFTWVRPQQPQGQRYPVLPACATF